MTTLENTGWICDGCGLEHAGSPDPPPLDGCVLDRGPVSDEELGDLGPHTRQWLTFAELAAQPHSIEYRDHGRGVHSFRRVPRLGIGQWSFLVSTPAGNLLWDPPAYLDDEVEALVRGLGGVAAIATSHPHMFAAQVSWSHAFGRAPVLVNSSGKEWLPRPDAVIEFWDGEVQPLPGIRVIWLGGHMPSSAVALTPDGSLLAGDTVAGSLDPGWLSFQRNYPRHVPLSAGTVQRLIDGLDDLQFDRLYTLGGDAIEHDAHDVVRKAARRHIGWVSGQFDHLT
jgi:glyoxylase-like metal-dependent hydrolase (beta-lactamase superfamily II)